jgi:hypothetical protein
LDARAWRRAGEPKLKPNEHGPVLNVFWSRSSGMGAPVNRKKDQTKTGKLLDKEKKRKRAFPIRR